MPLALALPLAVGPVVNNKDRLSIVYAGHLVAKCLAISSGAFLFFAGPARSLRRGRTPTVRLRGQRSPGLSVGRAGVERALMPSHAAPSGGRPATGPTVWWVTKTVPKVFLPMSGVYG